MYHLQYYVRCSQLKVVGVVVVVVGWMGSRIQRMFPVLNTHCSGHNTTTISSTMSTMKSTILFQSASRSSRPKVRVRVRIGVSAVLLAPMSIQMQKAVGLSGAPKPAL